MSDATFAQQHEEALNYLTGDADALANLTLYTVMRFTTAFATRSPRFIHPI